MSEKKTAILIIDDDNAILKMLSKFFANLGYEVHLAGNGEEGLNLYHHCQPDIILVDLNMPRVNGFEVLDVVSKENPDLPIIVISGEGEMADVIQALRLGAWNYHTKPIEKLVLIKHAVEQALEKAHLIKETKTYNKGIERKLGSIVENFPGFIFTCGKDHRITYMNPALTEYAGEKATGKPCHKAIFNLNEKCPWCYADFPATGVTSKQEFQDPESGRWYYEIHLPVLDRDNEVVELQIVLYDITERKLAIQALEEREEYLNKENIRLRSTLTDCYKFGEIIGKSRPMQEVYETIINAAGSDASVIIYGESGTGKELVAKAIHENSDRKDKSLIYVNCGAIPENLIESEFFGYKKGAFTGAIKDKHGFFDLATGGTIFLDEVGEIPINLQVKLLRAIEGNGYTPIGGLEIIVPDVRIISATNRDLKSMVKQGVMRQDFLYRIHIIPIMVPPLRERKEDIPLLTEHFLSQNKAEKIPPLTQKINRALQDYEWPGNVRELQNTLHRFVTLKKLDFMGLDFCENLPEEEGINDFSLEGKPLALLLEELEKKILLTTFAKYNFHQGNVAEALQIDRKTLYRKMKQFHIKKPVNK